MSRADDFHTEGTHLSWSALDRPGVLDRAATLDFDLVIIGGGITGAGVAREAALRGITFLLLDREDFAFGTSSRSSKLVHGGMRYLAQREWKLVRESTTERNWLLSALPNLVRPLGFHYCAYLGSKDSPGRVKAALRLYDLLSNAFSRYRIRRHRILTPAQLREREPRVRSEGMVLAGLYYDANVDDARLVVEVLKEARDFSGGRSVALNYAEAVRVLQEGGKVRGVEVRDRLSDRAFTVRAACVVNATGIWTGELAGPETRPTKGVHLAIPNARLGNREAFILRSLDDGRNFFVLRRGDISLIGTTDTDYQGPLDSPFCTREDADYLLRTVNIRFPGADIGYDDILSTYAGIRPLVKDGGAAASSVSRRHVIRDPGTGLVAIAGGKLTTFRLMGWDVLSHCSRMGYLRPLRGRERGRHFTRRPLKAGITWEAFAKVLEAMRLDGLVPEATLRHLHQQYGHGAVAILAEIKADPASGLPLLEGHPFCGAEIRHILEFENAPTLMDLMLRRTEMQLTVSHRLQAVLASRVAAVAGTFYGWDAPRTQREISAYLDYVRKTIFF
ncbi:glycerol-3-phosphate dehydrogenase/oxidase [Mesoterricola silvestris]|uniref:FAD-dependent glycerol-3-phosphate dehydrogenase n=1 Tax=Mesoterricola silvestris TaxID=2927979 RepID=A0AA48K7M2_9BACT|nr:glycerol-3-phosphate dehydrogenase/oxidase [Mesoterricola silvestris]BDU71286.1 FAD-dependent glycerol-3-phosphate dehydrogenase [Mesoterricola silvestris]